MPTDYYLKTNEKNGQREVVLCLDSSTDCEIKPTPAPPAPTQAPTPDPLDNEKARKAAEEAARIAAEAAEDARKAAAEERFKSPRGVPNARGGYYEKYMKYKAKYLALKQAI